MRTRCPNIYINKMIFVCVFTLDSLIDLFTSGPYFGLDMFISDTYCCLQLTNIFVFDTCTLTERILYLTSNVWASLNFTWKKATNIPTNTQVM